MEAQDLITRRCGECLSCRGALRRRGAWRGAATTSALGSRWQRAPSAGRRRPRSRQGGGKRHGREMREGSRDEDPQETSASSARAKKRPRGPPLLGGAAMSLHIVSMCQNSGAYPDSSHLAVDLFTDARTRRNPSRPHCPLLPFFLRVCVPFCKIAPCLLL